MNEAFVIYSLILPIISKLLVLMIHFPLELDFQYTTMSEMRLCTMFVLFVDHVCSA